MGPGLLFARRLGEAGVGLVQVNLGVMNHRDTHNDNFTTLKNTLLPPLNRRASPLIQHPHPPRLAAHALASYPPAGLAATVFRQAGIDPAQEVRDMFGRPFRLNSGTPIVPLLA